jgi:hypothetical protein
MLTAAKDIPPVLSSARLQLLSVDLSRATGTVDRRIGGRV